MRVAVALALFAGVTGLVAAVSLPSCSSDIPNKTCFADRVNASFQFEDGGVLEPNVECTRCLQTKGAPSSCCDAVGACHDDPTSNCPLEFNTARACVVRAGPAEEAQCKTALRGDKSHELYACMRSTCATECGIPSCDVDPSVILFANPSCDRCMGGACCSEINACYQSRRCKLSLECIITKCADGLGASMTSLGTIGEETIKVAETAICTGQGPIPGGSNTGITSCISSCIDAFTGTTDAPSTADDRDAQCLAFKVYTCGARTNCGPRCAAGATHPDASVSDAALDADAHD